MDTVPLLTILGAGVAMFVALLKFGPSGRADTGRVAEIAMAALASIDMAAALAVAWFLATILLYDGVMVLELGICAAVIAALAAIIFGAFALRRRGWIWAAIALSAVGAVPTIAVTGFLFYLDAHPINMR